MSGQLEHPQYTKRTPTTTRKYEYGDVKFESADGNIIYMGKHRLHGAATDDTSWLIYKLTWSGSDIVGKEKLIGAWDDRAALNWN